MTKRNVTSAPFILVIVGDSTAGKTTLIQNLKKSKKISSTTSIHDMDENGVPEYGREHWRKYRVDELLAEAIEKAQTGKSSIIGGWFWPHEIISSPYFSLSLKLHFLYLRNTTAVYKKRLRQRIGKSLTKEQYLSWSKGFPKQQQLLENQVIWTAHHTVIDSTKESKSQVLTKTLALIAKLSADK